jgi:[ribosomal protein S18]-alanine N-acetyltransferase
MSSDSAYRQVSILWAEPEHATELATLHGSLFAKAWDGADMQRLLEHSGAMAFLARVGAPGRTVGFILGQLAADEAEILALGVGSACQRHGIGRRLVEAFCRAARKANAKRLFLDVAPSNAAAMALYRAAGFVEVGRRKNYYEHAGRPPEDALTLAFTP